MVLQKTESHMTTMLSDTILALCRNTLPYEGEVSVEGLLGITLDNKEIFLVNINQKITKEGYSPNKSKKRPKRKSGGGDQSEGISSQDEDSDSQKTNGAKRKRRKRRGSKEHKAMDESDNDNAEVGGALESDDSADQDSSSHGKNIKVEGDEESDGEEIVFVKAEPVDPNRTLPGSQETFQIQGQSGDGSQNVFHQDSSIQFNQLQELAFQLSGDMTSTTAATTTPHPSTSGAFGSPGGSRESGHIKTDKRDNRPSFCCPICSQACGNIASLEGHIKQHNSPGGIKTVKVVGRKKSSLAPKMKENVTRKARTTLKCPVCDLKGFIDAEAYQVHLLTHPNVTIVRKERSEHEAFPQNVLLQVKAVRSDFKGGDQVPVIPLQHLKDFVCSTCKLSFSDKEALDGHLKSHGTADGEYWCHQCGTHYASEYRLKRHLQRIHPIKKRVIKKRPMNYECGECQQKCRDKEDMRRHMRKHTGEKPFKCDFCDRTFKWKNAKNSHMKRVHIP